MSWRQSAIIRRAGPAHRKQIFSSAAWWRNCLPEKPLSPMSTTTSGSTPCSRAWGEQVDGDLTFTELGVGQTVGGGDQLQLQRPLPAEVAGAVAGVGPGGHRRALRGRPSCAARDRAGVRNRSSRHRRVAKWSRLPEPDRQPPRG